MPCSAVTLSLATITGIIATALLVIAFSTDNWLYTEVKRPQIEVSAAEERADPYLVNRLSFPATSQNLHRRPAISVYNCEER